MIKRKRKLPVISAYTEIIGVRGGLSSQATAATAATAAAAAAATSAASVSLRWILQIRNENLQTGSSYSKKKGRKQILESLVSSVYKYLK